MTFDPTVLTLLLAMALMVLAAAEDVRALRIPNWLVAGIGLCWLAMLPLAAPGFGTIFAHLLTAACVLLVGILLFAKGWLGAGDGKLLAVCALWIGPEGALTFAAATTILGGAVAVLLAVLLSTRFSHLPLHDCAPVRERSVPYGVAIAVAAIGTMSFHAPALLGT